MSIGEIDVMIVGIGLLMQSCMMVKGSVRLRY